MGNYYSKATDFNISGEALGGGGGGGEVVEEVVGVWRLRVVSGTPGCRDHRDELIIIEGYGHSQHVSCHG